MIPNQLRVSSSVPRQEEETVSVRTVSEQDRDQATSGYSQGLKMEPCFQTDSLLPSSSTSLMSQLLSHPMTGRSLDPCILFPSSQATVLPQDYECGASRGEGVQVLGFPRIPVPASLGSAGERDQLSDQHLEEQLSNQHLQAKRARVESIIQGMSLPPSLEFDTSLEAAFGHEREWGGEVPRESKRKPKLPQQGMGAARRVSPTGSSSHARGCQQLKEQLSFLEQQLRRLQEKFSQVFDSEDTTQTQEGAKKASPLPGKPGDRPDKDNATTTHDPHRLPLQRGTPGVHRQEEGEDRGGTGGGLPSAARILSQALKHELAGVTSWVVDSVLKTAWPKAASHLLQEHHSLPVRGLGDRREYFAAGKYRKACAKPSPVNALGSPQAEAMSGASGKSPGSHAGSFSSKGVRKPCQVPSMPGSTAPVQDSQALGQLLDCSLQDPWAGSSHWSPSAPQRGPLKPLDLHWGTVRLRSSVVRQQQQPLPLSPGNVESLALLPARRDGCRKLQTAMDGTPFTSTHISFRGIWRGPWAWPSLPCPPKPQLVIALAGLPKTRVLLAPQEVKRCGQKAVLSCGGGLLLFRAG
ncbi:prospero homeobox protein 2 isoform X1 [Phaenicophaeus curvirostris]|uniref:prospero homeobox protein 2 isoform X1 n=1 Tax=Phaenicophaeus curvirostris TaxID=33595 RepID=UPI0037F0BAE5